MHTTLCRHAVGTVDDYIEQARARGLEALGFSCHNPMPEWYDLTARMREEELPTYVGWIQAAQARTESPRILLGLEADYFPGTEDYLRKQTTRYPFDYVIGSIHPFGGWMAPYQDREDYAGLWAAYYDLMAQSARSGLFDVIAHPDLVKHWAPIEVEDWLPLARKALEALAEAEVAFEINTSGLRKDVEEFYPRREFVEMAQELGVAVTLGSDAHKPDDVGKDLEKALKLLADIGYDSYATFESRQRRGVPLDGS